jgi:hypothetical protein
MGDSVNHDIRILGERNWGNFALNREEWKKILKKARAHADCRGNYDDDEEELL